MDIVCQVGFYSEPGYYTEEVRVLLGQGNGTFGAGAVVTTNLKPDVLALGDLDRDGALDMVVAQDSPNGGGCCSRAGVMAPSCPPCSSRLARASTSATSPWRT